MVRVGRPSFVLLYPEQTLTPNRFGRVCVVLFAPLLYGWPFAARTAATELSWAHTYSVSAAQSRFNRCSYVLCMQWKTKLSVVRRGLVGLRGNGMKAPSAALCAYLVAAPYAMLLNPLSPASRRLCPSPAPTVCVFVSAMTATTTATTTTTTSVLCWFGSWRRFSLGFVAADRCLALKAASRKRLIILVTQRGRPGRGPFDTGVPNALLGCDVLDALTIAPGVGLTC